MITFIYRYRDTQTEKGPRVELHQTFAYDKIGEDQFFIVSVKKAPTDKDHKQQAKSFAEAKYAQVYGRYQNNQANIADWQIISYEKLMELKAKIQFKNILIREIAGIRGEMKRGVKKVTEQYAKEMAEAEPVIEA